jgi:DNA-directed RNA polymerase subunit RPC12/RpoP
MAVRYAYPCPKCDSKIEITTTQAGEQVVCGNCSAKVTVPKLGVIRTLPRVGGGEGSQSDTSKAAKSASPMKGWLFAGGLLIAVIAGVAGGAAQYRANQFRVDVDIEKVVADEMAAIDKASPAEIYNIAIGATQEDFALEYQEAPYRSMNIKSGIIQWVAWACFGVAGVGLLMLLASFFVKS